MRKMEGIVVAWKIGNWIKNMVNQFHLNDFKLTVYPNFHGFEVIVMNDDMPDLKGETKNERNK